MRSLRRVPMTQTLPFPRPYPTRNLLFPAVTLCLWLVSALGYAPTLTHAATTDAHSAACKCAHCPGAAQCCCGKAARCAGN
ncbi:hypothetical protein EON79_14745 [bacterium]|nr:MAG: hypothetical protein EON79_14745 [bacterium]